MKESYRNIISAKYLTRTSISFVRILTIALLCLMPKAVLAEEVNMGDKIINGSLTISFSELLTDLDESNYAYGKIYLLDKDNNPISLSSGVSTTGNSTLGTWDGASTY
ncbi:MAG: hypothetical protein Q4D41_10795, partial [Prevotellaceae bacterium]|nr:hypothetical protein [Prevotellaceae bacterium]